MCRTIETLVMCCVCPVTGSVCGSVFYNCVAVHARVSANVLDALPRVEKFCPCSSRVCVAMAAVDSGRTGVCDLGVFDL